MSSHITRIQAKNVYGSFTIDHPFHEGVNIVYALNGYGKTTLIHILSNVLNRDWSRFVHIEFEEIRVQFSNAEEYLITRKEDSETRNHVHIHVSTYRTQDFLAANEASYQRLYQSEFCTRNSYFVRQGTEQKEEDENLPKHKAAYFPAFRSALDAFYTLITSEEANNARQFFPPNFSFLPDDQTMFARKYLNEFIPQLDYDAVMQLKSSFASKFDEDKIEVNKYENELFSNILSRLAQKMHTKDSPSGEGLENIYGEIKQKIEYLQETNFPVNVNIDGITELMHSANGNQNGKSENSILTRDALVYRDILQEMLDFRKNKDMTLSQFINSVNEFLLLTNKSVERDSDDPGQIVLRDHGHTRDLHTLSSGERQILSMLYFASLLSDQEVVLIDEPEMSLHVDWQRRLLPMLEKQLQHKQIIACTHSPIILRPYQDNSTELSPEFIEPNNPIQILKAA